MTERLAIVTGTTSGLGAQIASALLADGMRVVGIARRDVEHNFGENYAHVSADLADIDGIGLLVRSIVAEHGPPFALVNNAASGLDGLLPTMHNSDIARLLTVNLHSPIVLTKFASRHMVAAGCGRVVNVSSIVARTGYRGLAAYAATKAGLEGFTRSLARDLGRRGVTVNCVAPGFLETTMTASLGTADLGRISARSALQRFASLQEVAAAASYLVSDAAAGITGTVMTVDAGSTA